MKKNNQKNILLKPYSGDEKYIFVSYSHKDREIVLDILAKMADNGYRVWFDEGIDPGTEWDDNIATHIDDCGYFIAFVSKNYILSDNCKDELNYARDLDRKRLLIYLESVKLPSGLAMRLNRLQAIHKYKYDNISDFMEKLDMADGINELRDTTAKKESTGFTPEQIMECCESFCGFDPDNSFVCMTLDDFRLKKKLMGNIAEKFKNVGQSFVCVGIEDFINELINSIMEGMKTDVFRKKYTETSILIIDDADLMAGKSSTQEELYLILKRRYFESKPTMIIFHNPPVEGSYDKRLTDLFAQWKNISMG